MPDSRTACQVIDFDSSKLRLSRDPNASRARSLCDIQHQLRHQLQTSLELERLLELFLAEIRSAMPVSGLTYRFEATEGAIRHGEPSSQSLGYRLNHEGQSLGELTVHLASAGAASVASQLEPLLSCLLFPLRNALLYRAALQEARRDPLTGTGNRVAMGQTLAREIELARRHGQPLSLIMLDIDHFKQVNDRFGHHYGDEVLKAVATQLRSQLRGADQMFRYGGEEFLVVLGSTPGELAEMIGRRLCEAVGNMQFQTLHGHLPLSISLGCASYRDSEDVDALLRRADAALYQAKRNGRNQLHMAL